MHPFVRRREGIVGWQGRSAIRALEVDRPGIAGDHVAVGVLDCDGEAEGYAGLDAGRRTDEELARSRRVDRDAALRTAQRDGGGILVDDRLRPSRLQRGAERMHAL